MGYISPAAAAVKWNVSVRYVQNLLQNQAVPHAVSAGKYYLIPDSIDKPSIIDRGKYPPETGTWRSLNDTAAIWGIPPRTLYKRVQDGMIAEAIRCGSYIFIPVSAKPPERKRPE